LEEGPKRIWAFMTQRSGGRGIKKKKKKQRAGEQLRVYRGSGASLLGKDSLLGRGGGWMGGTILGGNGGGVASDPLIWGSAGKGACASRITS